MREFFRGWRRKIGVLTLLMAYVFTTVWNLGETLQQNRGAIKFNRQASQAYFHMDADWIVLSLESPIGTTPFRTIRFQHRPWSIYLSLFSTFISMYLLLSKPRKSTPKKTSLPVQDEEGEAAS